MPERFSNENGTFNKRVVARQISVVPYPLALQRGGMDQDRKRDQNKATKPICVNQTSDCFCQCVQARGPLFVSSNEWSRSTHCLLTKDESIPPHSKGCSRHEKQLCLRAVRRPEPSTGNVRKGRVVGWRYLRNCINSLGTVGSSEQAVARIIKKRAFLEIIGPIGNGDGIPGF